LPFLLKLLNFFLVNFEFLYKNRYSAFISTRIIQLYHKQYSETYVEEKEFIYDYNLFQQESKFLIGIWQVESYFKDIKVIIQNEFDFRVPIDKTNVELIKKINICNSISIHIRKGDYESSNWENTLGYVNKTNYYNNALNYIKERVDNAHFFIFSDDMEWTENNFKISNCTYVNHNKGKLSYIDMYLMSLCKHNIIANSTFSWWGAWLNKNKNKIIVMPKKWIMRDYYPEGIFPEEWIKLDED